jgi:hypothetical protein
MNGESKRAFVTHYFGRFDTDRGYENLKNLKVESIRTFLVFLVLNKSLRWRLTSDPEFRRLDRIVTPFPS